MDFWHALVLGIIEGVTEFLPISSTGHLTIAEKLLGYNIEDPSVTAFTAIIQSGAVFATLVYFWKDIYSVGKNWLEGVFNKKKRKDKNYKFGWAIIYGSIPVGVVGLVFKDQIETVLRSLWVVAISLILWSFVMYWADKTAKQTRKEENTTWKDTLIIGCAQCLALIPGVSRSGATMSAGLFRNFDRVTVTRLSFFLSIPALFAATVLQIFTKYDEISIGVGWVSTIIATIVSFFVAYVSIAWLLKFISKHSYAVFIWYRILLGILLICLLSFDVISHV